MVYRPFIGRMIVVLFALCTAGNCFAQEKSERAKMINYILSDTLNPEFHLIPINVRFKDSVWIGYKDALELYQFCESKYGWSRTDFIDKMGSILLNDKILYVDSNFISVEAHRIPKSECNSLYNEDPDRLRARVHNKDYYNYPDRRFACFVYKCFMNYVPLAWIEAETVYVKEGAWQGDD